MYKFPIGVMNHSFKRPMDEVIETAAKMGASGIQLLAVEGEYTPEKLTLTKRQELMNKMKANGLVFSALCGDFGKGFAHKELNPELIEKSKRVLDLAKELGTDIVTTHIGRVPDDKNCDRYKIIQEACFELARYADSIGSHFAVETGPEFSIKLKEFLDALGSKGVAVNLDPANLKMVLGDDPVQAVYNLKDYIVHTHAKDGNMLIKADPDVIYRLTPMPDDLAGCKFFEEVPLGTGSVDFPAYLKALEDIGYRGYLTIEREVGDDPVGDILTAVNFLNKTIKEN